MAFALGGLKAAAQLPRFMGPFAGDRGPQSLSRSSYGSISSPPSPGPQQTPPRTTYLSEKVPIPDTKPVRMLQTSLGVFQDLQVHVGISQAARGRSPGDPGKSLPALNCRDGLWYLPASCFCPQHLAEVLIIYLRILKWLSK